MNKSSSFPASYSAVYCTINSAVTPVSCPSFNALWERTFANFGLYPGLSVLGSNGNGLFLSLWASSFSSSILFFLSNYEGWTALSGTALSVFYKYSLIRLTSIFVRRKTLSEVSISLSLGYPVTASVETNSGLLACLFNLASSSL